MVKCKLVLKEQMKEERLKPAMLCGLDTVERRHRWSGWLEIPLCLSVRDQCTAGWEPSKPLYPTTREVLMELCRVKEPFLQPCTPRGPALNAALRLAPPLLDSTNILVSISELRNAGIPPRTHCGSTSRATQGKRGSRSCSCRQLLPPPRLNKGQPSSQIPETETETGETYPFSVDHSPRRMFARPSVQSRQVSNNCEWQGKARKGERASLAL